MPAVREVPDLGATFTVELVKLEPDGVIARLSATGRLGSRDRDLRIGVTSWPKVIEPHHLNALETTIADELLRAVRFVQGQRTHDWLEHVGSLIPKTVREPWLGDLREDRHRMAQAGHGRLFVEFATACQLLCLTAAVLWDSVKETISRSFRMG